MSTEMIWKDLGEITFVEFGRPQLTHIPKVAGLYRILSEDGWCYVGQAKDLNHRIYEYHRPTLDNEHEHRIHRLIRKHRCRLQITSGENLNDGSARKALENLAISAAKDSGLKMWNLSQNTLTDRLKMRISYHQVMIEELSELLAKEGVK
jgi:hypothetical protein